MNQRKYYITSICMAIVFIFFITPVSAKKLKIQMGDFQILPGIDYNGSYSTNIYADDKNKENDFIHTLTPGIRLEKKFASHNLISTGYSIGFVAYNDFNENNSNDHQAFLSCDLEFPASGITVKIDDDYSRTSNLLGTEDNEYGKGEKTGRWNNSLGFTASYGFGDKYSLGLTYQNRIQRFDDDEDKWQNRFDHRYSISLSYHLTAKTSFFIQHDKLLAEYDKQNDGIMGWSGETSQDYTTDNYSVGVKLNPIGKLDGSASFGYGMIKYDNSIDKSGQPYQDDSSWVASTSINYKMKNTNLSYKLQRSYKGSAEEDASSYVDTLTGISLTQDLGNRISCEAGFDKGYMDYSNGKSFDVYAFRTNLDWEIIKNFTTGIGYEYKKKEANDEKYADDGYDTSNFFLSLGFSISF